MPEQLRPESKDLGEAATTTLNLEPIHILYKDDKSMFTVTKRIEVSGAHFLHLDYESKCTNLHGHNWIITVTVQNDTLDRNGMVVDFSKIKEIVNQFDHHVINDVLGGLNPTAENIAKWLCDRIPHCIRVSVQETEGNVATYEKD